MSTIRCSPHHYAPIADYGAIGNLYTIALVGRTGSIDWCCLPDLDCPSVFAALLDHRRGGRFRIAPAGLARRGGSGRGEQRYVRDTSVLETVFDADGGRLSVTDFMPLRGSILEAGDPRTAPQLYRVLRCDRGTVEVEVEWTPRFDYARARTRITTGDGTAEAVAGTERLSLVGLPGGRAPVRDEDGGPVLRTSFVLRDGEHLPLLMWYGGGAPRWGLEEWNEALRDTERAWRQWLHSREQPDRCQFAGEWQQAVDRSGLTLKLLTFPDTGAIAAAATTSLPEEIGGVRNWDYRYTWIRDAAFTAQALVALGHRTEAVDFLEWCERVSMRADPEASVLRIMYGLRGEVDLTEYELPHLDGYCGSRPVRIGNAAAEQLQLDIYGELLDAAYELIRLGGRVDEALWRFLATVADQACRRWQEPDHGIWEVRSEPRHFVYSKLMVWVALDRTLRIAKRFNLPGDIARWRRTRDVVREAILTEGYDAELGAFVQAFGSKDLDAANLLIPAVGFLPASDPRVQGTIDRTLERLTEEGLVHRYDGDDGLPGGEGAFGLTTFWMVDALALSGRVEDARRMFDGVARRANHVGLFSEEFDPATGDFLGNFPQAFTHIGLINSALYIAQAEGRITPLPAPLGSAQEAAEAQAMAEVGGV